MRLYRHHGLVLSSAFDLPDCVPAGGRGPADISIRPAGAIAVENPEPYGFVPASGGGFAMAVPEAGVIRVREGSLIEVAPEPGADRGLLRLFLLGSGLGMALHQRGLTVLHAAGVMLPDGRAVAITGPSGAGKSTLAAALARRGAPILGDDTLVLHGETPLIWPGGRTLKLWADALDGRTGGLEPISQRTGKVYWPNPSPAPDRPAPLAGIVVLEEGPEAIEPLSGLPALAAIGENIYRAEYAALLGQEARQFRACASLAARVPVWRLRRPREPALLDRTAERLLRFGMERAA